MDKTYYTLYKVTNKTNGKFYIGTHKTKNLDDNYMGSGKYLKRAINKHGIENFEKEILFVFDTPDEMFAKEAEIVNEDFLAEENTYNLRVGGFGGFDYLNNFYWTEDYNKKRLSINGKKANKKMRWLAKNDKEWYDKKIKLLSKSSKKAWEEGRIRITIPNWTGKKHKEESKRKMSKAAKERLKDPTKNSQYGTKWIRNKNTREEKKISKKLIDVYLSDGWEMGRLIEKPNKERKSPAIKKTLSESHKKRISNALKGKKKSKEYSDRMKFLRKNQIKEINDKILSEEPKYHIFFKRWCDGETLEKLALEANITRWTLINRFKRFGWYKR